MDMSARTFYGIQYSLPSEYHATDLRTFLDCRLHFFFNNVLRLKPKENNRPSYFTFGTHGHKLLSFFYSKEAEKAKAYLANLPEDDAFEMYDSLASLYRNYQVKYESDLTDFEVAANETSMEIRKFGQTFAFTLDVLGLRNRLP